MYYLLGVVAALGCSRRPRGFAGAAGAASPQQCHRDRGSFELA